MATKKLFRFKEIKLDPYPGVLSVFSDRKQFCEYIEWYIKTPFILDNTFTGKTVVLTNKNERRYVVWVTESNTLVHELTHVALDIFQYINSDPREGNGEPFCYLIGHLLASCLAPKPYKV